MANTSKGRFPSYGLVRGPSHADGGVPASVANGPDVELEGGEYIIPKEAVPDYLPVLQQITQVGRDRQQMQNGNSSIDALIASASMQNGIAQPKSPVYQEGGVLNITGYDPRQEETFTRLQLPSSSGRRGLLGVINDAILKNRLEKQAELLGSSLNPEESSVLPRVSLQTPDGNKGNFGVTVSKPVLKSQFRGSDAEQMEKLSELDNLQNRPEMQNIMQALEKRAQQPNNIFDLLRSLAPEKQQGGMVQYEDGGEVHSRRMYNQGTGFDKKKSDLDGDGKISEYERKRGMAIAKAMGKMQEGGSVPSFSNKKSFRDFLNEQFALMNTSPEDFDSSDKYSMAMYSNPEDSARAVFMDKVSDKFYTDNRKKLLDKTGFSKFLKRSQNPLGIYSSNEDRVRRNAEMKYLQNEYGSALDDLLNIYNKKDIKQMGGMVGMQRPMNPAMNFSPMQRMNPRMYQEGGQVQPRKQQEMRNPNVYFGPPDSLAYSVKDLEKQAQENFESFMDSLEYRRSLNPFTGQPMDTDADVKRLLERMKKSKIPPSRQRMPMQEGGQVKASDMGLRNFGEVTSMPSGSVSRPEFEAFMNYAATEEEEAEMEREQMANFMSLLENEKRVRPVKPDTYNTTISEEDGMMIMSQRKVPKLSEAYMSAFGFATPLSQRQGALLQRKMIAPETLNPSVKGLINRVLVQRLGNENN